jgi:hypothetical protein
MGRGSIAVPPKLLHRTPFGAWRYQGFQSFNLPCGYEKPLPFDTQIAVQSLEHGNGMTGSAYSPLGFVRCGLRVVFQAKGCQKRFQPVTFSL